MFYRITYNEKMYDDTEMTKKSIDVEDEDMDRYKALDRVNQIRSPMSHSVYVIEFKEIPQSVYDKPSREHVYPEHKNDYLKNREDWDFENGRWK